MDHKKKKIAVTGGIVAGCIVLACICLLPILFFGTMIFGYYEKTSDDIAYYQVLTGEAEGDSSLRILGESHEVIPNYHLPKLAWLGPCEEYRFCHMVQLYSIFRSDSYSLLLSYNEEQYATQKAMLEEKYTYCTEDSPYYSPNILPGCTYEMDGFEIRLVEGKMYPKELLFIATSDSRQEIVILYFQDWDLDYISEPLGKFISENTGWDPIVNPKSRAATQPCFLLFQRLQQLFAEG